MYDERHPSLQLHRHLRFAGGRQRLHIQRGYGAACEWAPFNGNANGTGS